MGGPVPRWFADWVDAEVRATVVRWWEPLLVPGLLQTPEYARVLFKAWQTTGTDDEVENLVTARIDRHRRTKVMHDQLIRLAERPMIKVHVIPAEVCAHIGLLGAFAIAGFPDDAPGTVYFESPDDSGFGHGRQHDSYVRYLEV